MAPRKALQIDPLADLPASIDHGRTVSSLQLSKGPVLHCAGRTLELSRPLIMGIINTTPDSFSDGGTLFQGAKLDVDRAMARARDMVIGGAAVLDIGGESTRPGAEPVSTDEEMDRVIPLVERIAAELDTVISVDTSSPGVMREAASAGAGLINDVRALSREGALAAAAATNLSVCLMHMKGEPNTMQVAPQYVDVVSEVGNYLMERVVVCEQQGIDRGRLLLDPGFGFGKTATHNLQLLQGLPRLLELGLPLVAGLSRKSLIGKILGRDVDQRLPASIALAVLAAERGAVLIRTHDVLATADALAMWVAMEEQAES
jgi:dihydropteroate synthase